MKELTLITERYKGKTLTLTIAQWSKLLKVPKKTLYGRRSRGKKGSDFIFGNYVINIAQRKKTERQSYIADCYEKFNFSHGIINLERQKNGIR